MSIKVEKLFALFIAMFLKCFISDLQCSENVSEHPQKPLRKFVKNIKAILEKYHDAKTSSDTAWKQIPLQTHLPLKCNLSLKTSIFKVSGL